MRHLIKCSLLIASIYFYVMPALAVKFCNETSHVLQVATAFQKGTVSKSGGWYELLPGGCRNWLEDAPADAILFTYAMSDSAHSGDVITYEGQERFCIQTLGENFQIEGRRQCRQRNLLEADFLPIVLDNNTRAVTFTEPQDYGGRAAQAGVQRLLVDLGYNVKLIDGRAGVRSRKALQKAAKDFNLKADSPTDSNIKALLAQARAQVKKRGLQFCNRTAYLIWVSIGFLDQQDFQSQGWLRVPAQSCAQAINEDLNERYYFYYAEAVDENGQALRENGIIKNWGGDVPMCAKPAQFTISRQENCLARGLDQHNFKRIDTDNARYWVVELK